MIRIKYFQMHKNLYRTKKPIVLGQLLVHIYIYTEDNLVIISDEKQVLYEANGKNFANCQKLARKALKELGGYLETEIRKKPIL